MLSLSIVFQNIVNYYFICIEDNSSQSLKEIFLFLLFSVLINFAHGTPLPTQPTSSAWPKSTQ